MLSFNDFSIYFACPDLDIPVGGIRVIYQYVDMLNEEGVSAYVLHNKEGFRCTWFENQTQVRYSSTRFDASQKDIFVLPEVTDTSVHEILAGYHKVILNQNCYYTFEGATPSTDHLQSPYLDPSLLGCITVSEDSFHYLNYTFPNLELFRVRNRVDSERYAYRATKKNQIAYMPRKNAADSTQVFQMLRHRGALEGYEVVAIDGVSAERAAEIISESMFFFSFGSPEGFSLPPAEAMGTGSIVIGYHGWGGAEFLVDGLAYPIETNNVLSFSRKAEELLLQNKMHPKSLDTIRQKASQFIHSHYGIANQKSEFRSAWSMLVSIHAQRLQNQAAKRRCRTIKPDSTTTAPVQAASA